MTPQNVAIGQVKLTCIPSQFQRPSFLRSDCYIYDCWLVVRILLQEPHLESFLQCAGPVEQFAPLPCDQGAIRFGVSQDYTGYPQGNPYPSPGMHSTQSPMTGTPFHGHGGYGLPPTSPWTQPNSAPAQYPSFGGTPWQQPPPNLQQSPWAPQGGLPPQGYTPAFAPGINLPPQGPPPQGYTPAFAPGINLPPQGPPPPGWGQQQQQGYFPAQPRQPMADHNQWGGQQHYFPPNHGQMRQVVPEAPLHPPDRVDPFAQGPHYGPVLDPFLIRVVKAQVRLNTLLQPLPEDGSDEVHLKWNMLFPTSTVQRSIDPSHVSWSNGRDAPATFPRVSQLCLISNSFPWMIEVHAQEKERGVTCGEVIESIGRNMNKLSNNSDFASLPREEQRTLKDAYKHNRSRSPGVPGGQLGEGLKRLDFLRRNTMFAGIEANERTVKRICGEALPCTFVLKCSGTYPMTQKEIKDQEARRRAASSQGHRSRANSTTARVTVHPPSSDDDDGDLDHDR
ncbi:hypothetical protein GALMADRAFT_207304 [Galerina marginata CBS 339.88]|uniref:DUF6699 domain-containing protein n=1 Tax=Galerina marginata (strain CBS 339.88) TaxID=685588 RepID=A0A067TI06_GALM3|nr:hypothetical protein GALMADRAFT_207304 [Galerina marginata CBS 339.88]